MVAGVKVPRSPQQPITWWTVRDDVPPADPREEEREDPQVLVQQSRRRVPESCLHKRPGLEAVEAPYSKSVREEEEEQGRTASTPLEPLTA